jgi:hypothetical protein
MVTRHGGFKDAYVPVDTFLLLVHKRHRAAFLHPITARESDVRNGRKAERLQVAAS